MTEYTPEDKANVRDIVIYDIPSTMPQLEILTNLGKWSQVIAFKVKTQKKYSTVTVSIDFNKWALTNWNNGVWTAPFGGMPVRWFPASWTLKQRKECERFQAVVMDISKSITNNVVYNAENPTQSMLSQLDGTLAFKIIQDRGRRKLITYFDTWASLDKALNTEFNFEEFKGVWTHYFSPTLNRPKNKPPKKTDSTQKQNQDKNLNVTQKDLDGQKQKGKSLGKKKQSTSKNKGFDGNDKLTILAEIRALLRSLAN
ncbi:unnamed protein product [Rhizophagus irregularis]|nr:unnamed protein product [Rhizophagus irregularis]